MVELLRERIGLVELARWLIRQTIIFLLNREECAQFIVLVLIAVNLGVQHDLIQICLLMLLGLHFIQICIMCAHNLQFNVLERGGLNLFFESADLCARPHLHIECLPRDEVFLI